MAAIRSTSEFVDGVLTQLKDWNRWKTEEEPGILAHWKPEGERGILPWFRGEPQGDTPLLPHLYRRQPPFPENNLLQHFRRMAALPQFATGINREATDLWLFFARHMGLPTRLLDWTEGALTALYFAVREPRPGVVWMLVPQALNKASKVDGFELTWISGTATAANIRAAWENDSVSEQTALPLAIYPTHIHARLQVQQSCFTIHGHDKKSIRDLMRDDASLEPFLKCFEIDVVEHKRIVEELRILGVSEGSLFPDAEGLARDLTQDIWED